MSASASASDPGIETRNATLARNWWIVALRGLLGVAFGIVALVWPGITMLALVLVFASYSLLDGVLAIVLAVRGARRGRRWGLLLLGGILGIVAGIVAAVWPGLTVLAFVLIMAFWAVFTGSVALASAFDVKADHGRWWLGLAGLASIVYGALLFIAPLVGAVVLTWWVGAHALVLGVTLIVLAFRLRTHRDDAAHTASPVQAS